MSFDRVLFTVYLALSSLPFIAGQRGALQAPLSSQSFITTTSTIQGAQLAGNGVALQQFTFSSSAGPDSTSTVTIDRSTAANVTSNGMMQSTWWVHWLTGSCHCYLEYNLRCGHRCF